MASAVFILDLKGKILISRNYRGDIPMNSIEKFMPLITELEEDESPILPVLSFEGVFIEYFKTLEEESIRDNFIIIYELLDEMMDFGYPQTTEPKILKEYITQESRKLEIFIKAPNALTNAVSWRSTGIKYRKNEVFLDVIEEVNSNGNVLRCEVLGSLKMRCYLSGMPELKLGLNDKIMFELSGRESKTKSIELEDNKFHQCVRLAKFDTDRTISFIPPDGEFELMSYRINSQIKPLIWCEVSIDTYTSARIELTVKVSAQFKRRSSANNVEVYVPVPSDSDSPVFKPSIGSASYVAEKSSFVWKIRTFQGGRDAILKAKFGLPSLRNVDQDQVRPAIVKFEIPYFTNSGLQVRYLKVVERSGYQAMPWVRYITQNGDYHFRMPEFIMQQRQQHCD